MYAFSMEYIGRETRYVRVRNVPEFPSRVQWVSPPHMMFRSGSLHIAHSDVYVFHMFSLSLTKKIDHPILLLRMPKEKKCFVWLTGWTGFSRCVRNELKP